MSPTARSAIEASTNLWVKDDQNFRFGHFHPFHPLNLLLVHVLRVYGGGYSQGGGWGGGSQLPRGASAPSRPPPK